MKAILKSLFVIGIVGAVTIGATRAYFSDQETSTGNIFTAGTLNLKLDKDGVYYDGVNVVLFEEEDVKPADSGEETLSIRVEDNEAWLCAYLSTSEAENGCNEPEDEVDETCAEEGNAELDENMNIKIWWDDGAKDGWQCAGVPRCEEDLTEGDNVWQTGEVVYYEGLVSGLVPGTIGPYPLLAADGAKDGVFMGIEWSVSGAVGNIIQSDSLTLDAIFYAEQYKNQESGITCPAL